MLNISENLPITNISARFYRAVTEGKGLNTFMNKTAATDSDREIPIEKNKVLPPAVPLPRTIHLVPLDYVGNFEIRPGFYETNGATAIPGGVNFTVYSHGATAIELLLFHREAKDRKSVV